jgi:sortase (surface protein transpeptidase)
MFFVSLAPMPSAAHDVAAVSNSVRVPSHVKQKASAVVGTASRVVVPSVGIDIAVRPGSYNSDTQAWSIDDSSAFYADTTVPVNNRNGTTLIYGHARQGLFGTLPEVGEGAGASVYTAEGYRFIYVFEAKYQVRPDDVSALTTTGSPVLMLQTCSGAFDAFRTLVSFRLQGVMNNE